MRRYSKKLMIYCLTAGIVLILCFAFAFYFNHFGSTLPDTKIRIRYQLSLKNTSGLALQNAKLSVYGPVARTATQQCTRIEASHANQIKSDDNGNQSILFQWEVFPPLSTKVITVESDIQIWDQPQRLDICPDKEFLRAEPFIESDDSQIRAQAERLKGSTALITAENTYNWVAAHVVYGGYTSCNRGAVYALKYGKGDCTEYAYLFVALCRANAIPARPLGGFVCSKSMVVDPADYHNWAEFYLDGRWCLADPQNKKFMSAAPYYIAFQSIRPSQGPTGGLIGKLDGAGLEVKYNQ